MYKYSFDDLFFRWAWNISVPEGYELVEKEEHKQKKIEQKIKILEQRIEYHSQQGSDAQKQLKELQKAIGTPPKK